MRRLFGTDGIRGIANVYPITAELAQKLGKAAALVLRKKGKRPSFVIGKDTRLSGYMLEYALTSGIISIGADVLLVGPLPTPAVAHLTRSFAADAGIMISASHNPSEDNGIKFFDSEGFKLPDETELEIERKMDEDLSAFNADPSRIGKAHRIDAADARYIEYAKASIDNLSLDGLKIALDCANGAAYKVAPMIFRELGADLVIINNKPDGHNINKGCGALHPEVVRATVLGHKADIGICLDGDADRLIAVDEKGNILDGDMIMAICAKYLKDRGRLLKDTLVVTQYTNLAFDKYLKEIGISVIRTRNGDRYVIEKMRKDGYNLGGEQSGHMIFKDYNSTGDGTIAALQLLRVMKKSKKNLSDLAAFEKYPQVLLNVPIKEKPPLKDLPEVVGLIDEIEKKLGDEGRVLVRYSGTQDIARVMVEYSDPIMTEKYAKMIASKIKREIGK